ncbi:Sulfite exporter TauE/SafE [Planctomycetes bacterium CA13]|uniref:Probable membrane transporter protein n=2 Tax=Novipirellula herctigrandis TaxID=2527986 RepID=A0A5C5ZA49_9BACT|nr:Sulfite exporter TauE/SafE [Planctomycetes bacterium CA13]
MWVWYVLGGIAAGLLSSMFGVGAGILLVPLLSIAFGFGQKDSQGMALAVMVPMAFAGAMRYHFNPDIHLDLSVAAIVAVGGVLGAIVGSQIVFGIPDIVLKRMFACFIIVVGINILVNSCRNRPEGETPSAEHQAE